MRLVHRTLPQTPKETANADERLFEPEGSAEGCASGDCIPLTSTSPSTQTPPSPPPPTSGVTSGPVLAHASLAFERWKGAVEAVRQTSARHGKSLAYGRLVSMQPGEVQVHFPKEQAFHRATVMGVSKPLLEKALSEFFGTPTKLSVVDHPTSPLALSVGEVEAEDRTHRVRGIEEKVKDHPAVRAILHTLGGEVEHVQLVEEPNRAVPTKSDSNSSD